MNALPIVDRELRVRARQGTTYWGRCLLSGFAVLLGVKSASVYANALNPATIGPETFNALSWLAFLLACVSCLATADSISSERREGTLGLLFLTDLEGRDVILGKLTAAGVSAFYGLMGFLPALALAILSGGVTGGQFGRTALALLNALFLSLAAGIFISSRAHRQFRAMRNTLVLIGLLFVWSWVTGHLGSVPPRKAALFGLLSPYGAFYLAPDSVYAASKLAFWMAVLFEHGMGWVLLVAANEDVKRKWRVPEKLEERFPTKTSASSRRAGILPATDTSAGLGSDSGGIAEVNPEAQPTVEHKSETMTEDSWALLEQEPVCWAVSRAHGHNFYVWLGALLLLLSAAGNTLLGGAMWNGLEFLMTLGAGVLLAWGAGRSLFEARRSGELELLLCTPLGARDIVRGHWWALWRPLRAAWMLAFFVLLLQFIFSTGAMAHYPLYLRTLFTAWAFLVPVNKVLDGVAICWVAMWFGLQSRKPIQVVAWTAGLVIALPWVFREAVGFVLPRAAVTRELDPLLILLPLLVLAKNAFFITWAAGNLRTELRTTAALTPAEWVK